MSLSLREYSRVVFFTGAGLSAESGVPTYRGSGGIWDSYDYRDYACQSAFERDPGKVLDFHEERRSVALSCEPNDAHRRIARFASGSSSSLILTQNIDGLQQRAGAGRVLELHGSLWRLRCDPCGKVREDLASPQYSTRHCDCGRILRPDIVWFEDLLDSSLLESAIRAISDCDCLLSVGTSASVYPAAELPLIAMQAGATTIEINLEETPLSPLYHHSLQGKASEILSELIS